MNQYFPADFIMDYVTQNTHGLQRLQIYSIFRFLSAAEKNQKFSATQLQKDLAYPISADSFSVISNYLSQDCYFSPSFRENSYDPILLFDAIYMVESGDKKGFETVKQLINLTCPDIANMNFENANQEMDFFAALSVLSYEYPDTLSAHISELESAYCEELNFTFEDFVLYDFMDEYFETKNCRSNPKYQELIDTLTIATLKAQDITLEECVTDICNRQLRHPYSKFAGLYRSGAMELSAPNEDISMFKMLLEYAITYELRNNLFDFHLDADRIITLDNWKEKLKWYHTQYDNAYELAISSYYAAMLSRKLLHHQFLENMAMLEG